LIVYLIGVTLGLLGGVVGAREPRNAIGWLMIVQSALVGVIQLFEAYGYVALATNHGTWPIGSVAAWLGAWIWVPSLGFLALITVRFPSGQALRRWRAVDWIYVLGTALFSLAIALSPSPHMLQYSPIPAAKASAMYAYYADPVPAFPPPQLLNFVAAAGLTLILAGNVVAAGSLIERYRRAQGDERLQIKWFAYAGGLCAIAAVYGGLAWNLWGVPLYQALTPLEVAALTIPATIGIAILRYRLYNIDLIINRTLVYGTLTAILGAMYAAAVTLFNRLFISVSGQKSDAAYVVTAFVVVVAASPLKDWLQRQVDRRIRHASPAAVLDEFRANVEAVVSVIDVQRVASRLVDRAVEAFDARGAALYLGSGEGPPTYARGRLDGDGHVEVALRYADRRLGHLVLGSRRGDVEYTEHDRLVLQRTADSVGEALALAAQLGFQPLTSTHRRTPGRSRLGR
jgi:hypothetical protein